MPRICAIKQGYRSHVDLQEVERREGRPAIVQRIHTKLEQDREQPMIEIHQKNTSTLTTNPYPITRMSPMIAVAIRLCFRTAMNRLKYKKTHMTALVGLIMQASALEIIIFLSLDLVIFNVNFQQQRRIHPLTC